MDGGAWCAGPWGCEELAMTEVNKRTHTHTVSLKLILIPKLRNGPQKRVQRLAGGGSLGQEFIL